MVGEQVPLSVAYLPKDCPDLQAVDACAFCGGTATIGWSVSLAGTGAVSQSGSDWVVIDDVAIVCP